MIEELRLRNFEGFANAKVRFTEGLNLITGRNSTGKTSLLDSIVYALYGVVPEVESRLLVSRMGGAREMEVYLRFRSPRNGSRVEIYKLAELRRGRFSSKASKLIVDGKEVQVEGLEDLRRRVTQLLGTGYRAFGWVVYARQGRLTEILEPRRVEMDAVLEITLLRELDQQLDEARRWLSRVDGRDAATEHRSITLQLLPLQEERLKELRKEVERLEEEAEAEEKALRRASSPAAGRLLAKAGEYERVKTAQIGAEKALRELLARYGLREVGRVESEAERLREKLLALEEELKGLEEEVEDARREEARTAGELQALKQHHETHLRLLESKAARCPTCGQPITPETMRSIIEEEEARIAVLGEALVRAERARRRLEKKLDELRKEEREARKRRERLRALLDSIEEQRSSMKEREKILKSLRVELQGMLRALNLDIDPDDPELVQKLAQRFPSPEELEQRRRRLKDLKQTLAEKRRDVKRIEKEIDALRSKAEELERRLRAAELAERLRRRLSDVVEGRREVLLKAISLKATSIFRGLTDQRLYTDIEIDPETYKVYVTPIGVSSRIPATRVGGGHQTLIALSIRLALLSRLGSTSLLILDEPTYGVDEENLQLLLNQLARLTRHVRQAIIVTHHGRGVEEADNIIEVYKDPDGYSRIRQSV